MLLFNGTSVEDGRRIITSDVDTLTRGRSPTDLGIVKSRIFRDAHDFHDLFSVHSSGGHNGIVISVAFSPDGTRVVTASFDKTARIWDVASGTQVGVLEGHKEQVYSARFSPDGKRIVTASWDDTARVWNAANFTELTRFKGHTKDVNTAAFSPDGVLVVSASDDGTIRIWNAENGEEKSVLEQHDGLVFSVEFDRSGKRIGPPMATIPRAFGM